MIREIKVINFTSKKAEIVNKLLEVEADGEEALYELTNIPEDTTVETWSVEFDDGMIADLKLCSGQTNLYIDPVLFKPDKYGGLSEVQVLDVRYEITNGDEYMFGYGDTEYIVKINII